jgi:hypothetical protein
MNRPLAGLALFAALFATACDDQPTSPRSGQRPSAVIYDGANGAQNTDVFFLPPLVRNPSAFFDAAFNPNVTSAVFQICRAVDATSDTCAGNPVATFGDVAGATGPIVISVRDEHYLALWHTGEANLDDGLYLIRVFFDEPAPGDEPVAWAHVQVVSSGKELKTIDNQTIGLLDGRTLPINVRFEGDCLSTNCASQVVTEAGATLVLTSTGDGALVLQDGWLPEGISSVRVTLQRHEVGEDNDCVGNAAFTGPGLVAQTEACLEVTTDPVLPPAGIQQAAYIFACLEEPSALREFMQIIKADDGRPLQALADVSDEAIQTLGFDLTCGPDEVIGLASHPLMRLASRVLRAVTRPVAQLLEVKPLYAIDLGQGGEIPVGDIFSYFAFGVKASAAPFGSVPTSASVADVVQLQVQVTGQSDHPEGGSSEGDGAGGPGVGLADIGVTFTITDAAPGGGLTPSDAGGGDASSLTVQTNADGVATAYLSVGPGGNVVEAVAMVGGKPVTLPVTFTVGQTLVECSPESRGADLISRGWYIESFPGVSLTSVQLELLARALPGVSAAGLYTLELTARSSAYNGPVVGRSRASVTLDGTSTPVPTTFQFANPSIAEGSLVTFALAMISGPADSEVLYGVFGSFAGDPTCPIIETEDTDPPLSEFRRQGIVATIAGGASPPVIE